MNAFRTIAVAGILALGTAAGASASTVTLKYTGPTAGAFGKVTLTHLPTMPAGSVTKPGDRVLAGAFNFDVLEGKNVVASIIGWCMDLSTFLNTGTRNYGAGDSFVGGVGEIAGAGDRVQRLFDAAFHLVDPTDKVQSTAMQTAIWEVIYDTDFSLSSGGFRATSALAGVVTAAQTWLALAKDYDGGKRWRMTYYDANAGKNQQDIGTASPIPLPAAGWLLIGGLAAFGTVARRRKAATA